MLGENSRNNSKSKTLDDAHIMITRRKKSAPLPKKSVQMSVKYLVFPQDSSNGSHDNFHQSIARKMSHASSQLKARQSALDTNQNKSRISFINRTNIEVTDQQTQVEQRADGGQNQEQQQSSTITFQKPEPAHSGVYSDTNAAPYQPKSLSHSNSS